MPLPCRRSPGAAFATASPDRGRLRGVDRADSPSSPGPRPSNRVPPRAAAAPGDGDEALSGGSSPRGSLSPAGDRSLVPGCWLYQMAYAAQEARQAWASG